MRSKIMVVLQYARRLVGVSSWPKLQEMNYSEILEV